MAIKLIDSKYCATQNDELKEYLCDTDADFENLPTSCTCAGSTAVSVESGAIRVVNAAGQWVAFGG